MKAIVYKWVIPMDKPFSIFGKEFQQALADHIVSKPHTDFKYYGFPTMGVAIMNLQRYDELVIIEAKYKNIQQAVRKLDEQNNNGT